MKSRQRVIDHGEVFTPPQLVNDMLDLVAHECERIDSRFLEPACGDGNFLAEVLRRKLRTVDKNNRRNQQRWERDALLSLCSLYGIDLLPDNIESCRARLLDILSAAHEARYKAPLSPEAKQAADFVLQRNIVQGNALTLLHADEQPIVFSEWSPINGTLIKRRDFKYDHLVNHAVSDLPLFSDLGEEVYVPQTVREFRPCHYLKLAEAEESSERS
ncbi:MAG: hypothetical protein RLZZ303_2511 [Candidatus Hydrogenedentota bacterium]|jgi:hypothetical protein